MIHTKLHELKQVACDEPVVDLMLAAPKFVISDEVFNLLYREDVKKAVLATVAAGLAHLPYDPVCIEFHVPGSNVRHFALFAEGKAGGQIVAHTASIDPLAAAVTFEPTMVTLSMKDDGTAQLAMENWIDNINSEVIATALCIAFLMLNVRGIDKEVIHTDRLNKARAKCGDGRPPIPSYTVIRIGSIYDRSGHAHSVGGSGRHMPVHLRAGYVRGQWFGKGREDYKQIFIPPCIVNYREEDDVKPRLPQKEVRV